MMRMSRVRGWPELRAWLYQHALIEACGRESLAKAVLEHRTQQAQIAAAAHRREQEQPGYVWVPRIRIVFDDEGTED